MFTPLDPKPLRIFSNDRDLLQDLFIYLEYVGEHSVKRMTRTNEIPKPDSIKIAKLLGDPELVKLAQDSGGALWIDFIDNLALQLQLVRYDTKGEYRGYSSSEPSFVDNYIVVSEAHLRKFLELPPAAQEKRLLDTLIHLKAKNDYSEYSNNEFYQISVLGGLDPFNSRGSALGLMPTLKFPAIRLFLLDVLKNCPAGQWFSTESLIAYLKINHPFFLIPKNIPKADRWGKIGGRYDNFYEGKNHWDSEKTVQPDEPDAFERVEGRYVERFLENIPLTMRFVDVAYNPAPYTGLLPSRGQLKAFRVNERFLRLMSGEESAPKVTVQPNFDIVIESDFYPAGVVRQVAALGERVSNPNSGHGAYVDIYQLKKAAVAAAQVHQPDLNVIALLKRLSGRDLPPNVQIELEEWAGHADQFTLYESFSLLEMAELPLQAEKFIGERISPTLNLMRSPDAVFAMLETLGHVPLRMRHPGGEFTRMAESADSVFPKESAEITAPKTARPVKVSRVVTVSYQFPDAESFDIIQKTLAELRCPFQTDSKTRIVSIQQKDQGRFDEAMKKLQDTFAFEIE